MIASAPRAGDIAADHIDSRRRPPPARAPRTADRRSARQVRPHREVDHARSRLAAHRGDIAQVDRQRARAERLRRPPLELEMNALDHRVDGDQLARAGGAQDRAIVAGTKDGTAAVAAAFRSRSISSNSPGDLLTVTAKAAKGVTRILRGSCRATRRAATLLTRRSRNHARASRKGGQCERLGSVAPAFDTASSAAPRRLERARGRKAVMMSATTIM